MKKTENLKVSFRGQPVGMLSRTPDNHLNVFEYDKSWLTNGFSISPLELPLKAGAFIAKPTPFNGNFGIFEDSLPDGYGRYLLHKTLLRQGVNDSDLSSLDRLAPAYDLTLCTEGYNGEHATSVNGTGHPEASDFIAVGKKIKIPESRCHQLIKEVTTACQAL